MSKLLFAKYEGAGNDFILIDDRRLVFSQNPFFIQKLCDRKEGIGADGLILLQYPFTMRIFNADGTEADSCGNGLRCFARFLLDLQLPCDRIETKAGPVFASTFADAIAVDMPQPKQMRLQLSTDLGVVHFVDSGVPHAVHFAPDPAKINLSYFGSILRRHAHFQPAGANISVALCASDGSIAARTFERGVEAETRSCGTGAVAIAAIARKLYHLQDTIKVIYSGGELLVQFKRDAVRLIGPARKVFEGIFLSA